MLIAAIDAGAPRNVGWAVDHGDFGSGELDGLLEHIVAALSAGGRIALGIEAPLWIPAGREFETMSRSRGGIEAAANRAWSASPGSSAMAMGLANLTWVLERIAMQAGPRHVTTQTEAMLKGEAQLFIWEAIVTAKGKPATVGHCEDARSAVDAFSSQWPDLLSLVPGAPAVNLAWTLVCAAGHKINDREARMSVPVIGPRHSHDPTTGDDIAV